MASKKSNPSPFPTAKVINADEASKLIPKRVSVYDKVIEQIVALKPNQSAVFPFPKDHDVRKSINSLNAVIQSRGVKAPAGYGFFKSIGTSNELIVSVRERKVKKKAK